MAHKKTTGTQRTPAKSTKPASAAGSGATEAPSTKPSRLRALYVELASDPAKLSAFIADPQAVVKAAGLSKEEAEILFSGDQGRIYMALRPESPVTPPPAPPQPSAAQPASAEAAASPEAARITPVIFGPPYTPCISCVFERNPYAAAQAQQPAYPGASWNPYAPWYYPYPPPAGQR